MVRNGVGAVFMVPFRIAAGGSVRGLAMSVGRWGGSFLHFASLALHLLEEIG